MLESFGMYLILESNNHYVPQLNKFEEGGITVQCYLCIIRNFNKANIRSVCAAVINNISVTRVTSLKLHLIISYVSEDQFSSFSAFCITFICAAMINPEFQQVTCHLPIDGIWKRSKSLNCCKLLKIYYLELQHLIHFDYIVLLI